MKKYLFLLALGVACGGSGKAYDDDDSSGDAGHKAGGAGRAGNTGGGRGGAVSSGTGGGGVAGSATSTGGMSTAGRSSGGAGSGGSAASSGTSSGGQGAVSQGGDTSQGGAGEGGVSGDSGTGGDAAAGGEAATGGNGGAGGTSGKAGAGGTSGKGGSAGTSGAGGSSSGTAGKGGTGGASGGTAGKGGTSGSSGTSHMAGGPDGGVGGVSDASDQPLVELVIDGSSSMFEDGLWDQVYAALVTDGVLGSFESKLDLGLSIYQGRTTASTSESDPNCAIMTNVSFAGDNAGEIGQAITTVGNAFVLGTKYETPTNFAVHSAIATLGGVTVPVGVKKYIVLVTDGAPNTCLVHDPQCGQDASVAAVEDARTAGIRTLVVGLGALLTMDDGCPTYARCGEEHLQDVANAGVGAPVEPPNANYRYLPCTPTNVLQATYTTAGNGGTATFYVASNPGGLSGELTSALQAIVDGTVP